jgi:hypothetical protein
MSLSPKWAPSLMKTDIAVKGKQDFLKVIYAQTLAAVRQNHHGGR